MPLKTSWTTLWHFQLWCRTSGECVQDTANCPSPVRSLSCISFKISFNFNFYLFLIYFCSGKKLSAGFRPCWTRLNSLFITLAPIVYSLCSFMFTITLPFNSFFNFTLFHFIYPHFIPQFYPFFTWTCTLISNSFKYRPWDKFQLSNQSQNQSNFSSLLPILFHY